MEHTIDTKITEKIQKLLAMAEHPNSNENEAAIALEIAQEMLLKHNLTRADIINNTSETPVGIGKLTRTESDGYTWKRNLVTVLADANLCRVVGSPQDKAWHIFGQYDNVRSVLEMYNWVTLQLVFMANRDFRAYKQDEGTERGQTWKAGFYAGATIAIRDRLAKPMETFSQGTGHALVIANKAQLATAVYQVFPRLSSRRAVSNNSLDGRNAGKSAGSSMALSSQRRLTGNLLLT